MPDGLPAEVEAVFQQGSPPLQAEPEPRPAPAPPYRWWEERLPEPIASLVVTVDTLISRGPTLFWGYALQSSAAWSLTLRNGVNTSAPAQFAAGTAASTIASVVLTRPVLFRDGLFADLGAGLTNVTILYEPLREEQLVPRQEGPAETE